MQSSTGDNEAIIGQQPDLSALAQNNDQNQSQTQFSNQGKVNMSNATLLGSLFGQSSLISSTHSVAEVSQIAKFIEDTVKDLKKQTASSEALSTLPGPVQHLTADITPNLPGIALYTVFGNEIYVMPVLFYKIGVTDATETMVLNNGEGPRGFAKAASTFMNKDMLGKVVQSFKFFQNKKMENVVLTSPCVINLERYIKNGCVGDEMIREVSLCLLREWSAGLLTMGVLQLAKEGAPLPSPFKGGKVFGDQDAAIARIEPAYAPSINGVVTPYNLQVSLVTANKNGQHNPNSPQAKTVCKTMLNVQLEAMSPNQFNSVRTRHPGRCVGPLVPVILTGYTQPGETLNSNQSILSACLGLYAALAANNPRFFSEAFRGKDVGHRGNLGVFNNYMTTIMGPNYATNQFLTDKNIQNVAVVNEWIQRYVSQHAVFAIDVPLYGPESSMADFWLSLAAGNGTSTYAKAMISVWNALTGNKFSEIANSNAALQSGRDKTKQWAPGDAILVPTMTMRPRGIAKSLGKDGTWFDLGEMDDMMLRQGEYYGTNETAIAELKALIQGTLGGGDQRVRQFNITNRLQQLFQNNVHIDGWDVRLVWSNALFNTVAEAMVAAGSLTVGSANHSSNWFNDTTYDVLDMIMTAGLNHQGQSVANVAAMGLYSQM